MNDIGQKLLDGYNALADKIVGWEVEQIGKGIGWILTQTFSNLDVILPFAGIVGLFVFKPTRTYAVGSLVLGLIFL